LPSGWVLKRVKHTWSNYPEISKRDTSQEGLWGQIDTELAAGRPPRGSGRHLGQQGRVPKEEPLACSAAAPSKGLTVAVNRSPQVMRPVLQLKPMQVCFVRGLGSPCSQARCSAHKAPISKRTLGTSGEQARSHVKANGSELGSCKSWSCQASQQGPCHGLKPLSNKQGRLGAARKPASGQDVELHNSNSVRDESHAKLRREFCCSP
jgi:hypothetical protein